MFSPYSIVVVSCNSLSLWGSWKCAKNVHEALFLSEFLSHSNRRGSLIWKFSKEEEVASFRFTLWAKSWFLWYKYYRFHRFVWCFSLKDRLGSKEVSRVIDWFLRYTYRYLIILNLKFCFHNCFVEYISYVAIYAFHSVFSFVLYFFVLPNFVILLQFFVLCAIKNLPSASIWFDFFFHFNLTECWLLK